MILASNTTDNAHRDATFRIPSTLSNGLLGLFAGISLEGTALVERKDANKEFYGSPVPARDILGGRVPPPEISSRLYEIIEAAEVRDVSSYRIGFAKALSGTVFDGSDPMGQSLSFLRLLSDAVRLTCKFNMRQNDRDLLISWRLTGLDTASFTAGLVLVYEEHPS